MNPEILQLYKNMGETPLECIRRFQGEHPSYMGVKMTYLGRLDPMAEGLLLVLAGDTRKRADFLSLDKTYEFEVLWGFSTDTYDVLGILESKCEMRVDPRRVETLIDGVRKVKSQKYPPYSSRTVGGKPLFQWARENKIDEIDVPTRGIKVFDIKHIYTKHVTARDILEEVLGKINLVTGDFRQEEISKSWRSLLDDSTEKYLISKFVADVSTGTYIRSLAHEMGKMLGGQALAYSIKRTRVGQYKI